MGLRIIRAESNENFDRLRALRSLQIEHELKRWAAVTSRGGADRFVSLFVDNDATDSQSDALFKRLQARIAEERPRVEFVQGNLDFENISKLLED
jgi:hypothetical protein